MCDLDKAVANGVASLDEKAKIPVNQLPDEIIKINNDGIKGDYCSTYGILAAPNGVLTANGMKLTLKAGLVLQCAGQEAKTTIASDTVHEVESTQDFDFFYADGAFYEATQVVYSRTEPENGDTGILAWWNPDIKKWKFKSNAAGNVWAEAVATPVAHIHTDGTTITRIDHIGYRVLDDEVYALKSETTTALAGKANIDLSNVPTNIDYVVEYKNPTDSDPTWYRKWKSGKLEQGGVAPAVVENITFLKPFANTNYTVIGNISLTYRRIGQGDGSGSVLFFPEATSFCYVSLAARNFGDIGTQNIAWRAEGQGAN